ncbi:unnamed protein product [Callosobruchus maculatus]|uniref:Protein MIX23 n=1 Tax=Callosobruchus maculatus TaxID=64391 RepID=A0A653BXG1_CALMS|nr:unnamed protein product [Callosobruchus maculatus]
MADTMRECEDFSAFQEILKTLRKTDDIIVSTINTAIPTDSFHKDAVSACKTVHSNIEEGHNKREKFIKNCISFTADSVKRLKAEKEANPDDRQITKKLKEQQTKCHPTVTRYPLASVKNINLKSNFKSKLFIQQKKT